ncbi:MAG TPA: pirin family protein [Actinomycetota bacterium]|jgi:quercetin 2,3-dioxygenase|nr:pirin family protein [Actinomycetota bacterium]
MPAITPADATILRRLDAAEDRLVRPVVEIVDAPSFLEGEGFKVRRATAGLDLSWADPFLLLDHMGAVEYAPGEAKGAPDHPHRGFETVTYMLDGRLRHLDSHGGGGVITDGATQWMTAGSGVVHSEMPTQELLDGGGLFHGFQLWVNLPSEQKWLDPRYQDLEANDLGLVASEDAGAVVRLIAGSLGGVHGPGDTQTPITYAHATLAPGARLRTAWRPEFNALVYIVSGRGAIGAERRPIHEGQIAVLGPGEAIEVRADPAQDARNTAGMDVLLLGGLPIREQIAWYGPFVMNTRDELVQAVEDYQSGRMGAIPPDLSRT